VKISFALCPGDKSFIFLCLSSISKWKIPSNLWASISEIFPLSIRSSSEDFSLGRELCSWEKLPIEIFCETTLSQLSGFISQFKSDKKVVFTTSVISKNSNSISFFSLKSWNIERKSCIFILITHILKSDISKNWSFL